MNLQPNNIDLSILIVTFKERATYVKDLIHKVRKTAGNDVDILLAINGNNEEMTDETYRLDMLNLASNYPRYKYRQWQAHQIS